MDIFTVILQPALIALLLCLCAVAGVLYVLAQFVKDKATAQKKLSRLDAELGQRRRYTETKGGQVKELQEALGPLKAQESERRVYYEKLAVIQRDAEAQDVEAEEVMEVRGQTPAEKKEKTIGTRRSKWD